MEKRVVELRKEFPVWGGRKLARVLKNRGVKKVPAPSTTSRSSADSGQGGTISQDLKVEFKAKRLRVGESLAGRMVALRPRGEQLWEM
jgi:hypothetical protein